MLMSNEPGILQDERGWGVACQAPSMALVCSSARAGGWQGQEPELELEMIKKDCFFCFLLIMTASNVITYVR